MLQFTVKANTHNTITTITKFACWLGFIGAVVFFAYTLFVNYQKSAAILADPVIINAPVTLEDVTLEEGRRGRIKETYHFQYSYEVGGQWHKKDFTSSESNAKKYLDADTIEIAYLKSNPAESEQLDRLQKNSSLSSLSLRGLVALLGLMFLAFALFKIITAKLFITPAKANVQSTTD